ncbi:MAG: AbrB/MazE/SpoVT family DNA-binding domain-containing protein [Candidatus Nitrotoga sp.]|nr:AbrB/MazE/SpoVT family DNA-binding domain-containing protein [Nitrosomonadales bacterium]
MCLKTTPNKQITLPDETASQMEVAGCSDVEIDRAAIILTPDLVRTADAVRDKLIALGIFEKDIADACAWARRPKEE